MAVTEQAALLNAELSRAAVAGDLLPNFNVQTIGGLTSLIMAGTTPYNVILIDQEFGLSIRNVAGPTLGKLGFHTATPVVQRKGAAQDAVVTTGAALTSYGFTETQANSIVTLLNEIRAALVEVGLIKGAA